MLRSTSVARPRLIHRRGRIALSGRFRPARHLAAHHGRHLGAEQLDRAQHAPVRQRADAELDEEALVAEDLVLRSEEHTSELQSRQYLVCRLLLEKKKKYTYH